MKLFADNKELNIPPQWNLLTNSKGPFQPNLSSIDNQLFSSNTTIHMVQGQKYTLTANTNGTFTNVHDNTRQSDNVTIWLAANATMIGSYAIISNTDTTTGTTFIWNQPTGDYIIRVNTYRLDNSIKAWNIKIEKGNCATPWTPAIADLMLKNQNGGGTATS